MRKDRNRKQPAKCLALLGTGSDVGKSVLTAGLCRHFRNRGVDVAPFKAQNMSNNSYVTREGGEMGRAQIVQAQAARLEPHVDMNPVLLKPSADTTAQVILHGRAVGHRRAGDYFADTDALFAQARQSLTRLRARHDLIVLEGAGSCAEVNLRSRDFVNFRMAAAAEAPVLLVADIDRGGVFAQIVGTLAVLPPEDRDRVAGLIVNRFRGEARLFDDGIAYLERKTHLPVLGLIPWLYHVEIDSEDHLPLEVVVDPPAGAVSGRINIAVLRWPHISNFTDFNPLQRERLVNLHYLARPRRLSGYDLVLLPGSKNARGDLDWFRRVGWETPLAEYHAAGGRLGGICGGYQMLGRRILDPEGVESPPGETPGLGYLDVETTLRGQKTLTRTQGLWRDLGETVDGYEIHMGTTHVVSPLPPMLEITARNAQPVRDTDGAQSDDGRVWGTYLHGLFDEVAVRGAFLRWLCPELAEKLDPQTAEDIAAFRDRQYELLAEHVREHLDLPRLEEILRRAPGNSLPALC